MTLHACAYGGIDAEIELRRETGRAQHSERIVAESDIRIKGCLQDARLHITEPAIGVAQSAVLLAGQGDRQGVDGKVAARKIAQQGRRLDLGFPRIGAVNLAPGGGYLDAGLPPGNEGRAEISVRDHGTQLELPREPFGKSDAVPLDHQVKVLGRPLHEQVAHIAADQVDSQARFLSQLPDGSQYGLVFRSGR